MQIQKQVRTNIVWQQRLEPTFLLKFPWNVSSKITFSSNLAIFTFSVAHQITGLTDFPWKHFVKTLMWPHIIHDIVSFNVLFIWLKNPAVSAWNFKFKISCFLYSLFENLYYIHMFKFLISVEPFSERPTNSLKIW